MKKKTRVNSVSMLNSQFWSWVWDDLIRSKLKNNYDTQSSINLMLNDGIEIKNIYKLKKNDGIEIKNIYKLDKKNKTIFQWMVICEEG